MAGRAHLAMDLTTPDVGFKLQSPTVTKDRSHLTQSILKLTLEIMYLLTGERCAVVTMASVESLLHGMFSPMLGGWSWNPMEPPCHTSIPERNNETKILEVTNKMIELLTGEVPIRCQDVTVSLSMEEWEYLEGHKEIYTAAMMKEAARPSPADEDDSGKSSEGCPIVNPDLHVEDTITEVCPVAYPDLCRVVRLEDPYNPKKSIRVKSETLNPDCCLEQHSGDRSVPFVPEDCTIVKTETSTTDTCLGPHSLSQADSPNPADYIVKVEGVGLDCHSGLRSVISSSASSDPGEWTHGKSNVRTADASSGLHSNARLDDPSHPKTSLPIKSEIHSPDINLGLHSLFPSKDPRNPKEGLSVKSESLTPDNHLGLRGPAGSPDPFNLEESTAEKSEIFISGAQFGFPNGDRLDNLSVPKSVTPGFQGQGRSPGCSNVEKPSCDIKATLTQDIQPELHSRGRSPRSCNPKESPPYKLIVVSLDTETELPSVSRSPKNNAEESSPDHTAAATLDFQPGLYDVGRVPHCSSPEEFTPDYSYTIPTRIHPGLPSVDVSSNPEGSQTSRLRYLMPSTESGFNRLVRSPYSDCLEECTPDKLALFISNLKPGLADFFPDPPRSLESSRKNYPRPLGPPPKNRHRFVRPHSKLAYRPVEPSENPSRSLDPSEYPLRSVETSSESSWRFVEPFSENPAKCADASSENAHRADEPFSEDSSTSGESPLKRIKTTKHRIVYPSDNIYPCSECKQQFVLKSDLIVHQKVHAGISGFTCPVCGKPFKGRAELSRHVRSHTGEKPFACSVCGKCFTRRPNLLVHERIHRGEKPFTCPKCSRSFTHKQSFERHLILHTDGVTFYCLDCGKDCKNKAGFLAHQRLHTRKELECDQPLISQALLKHEEALHKDRNSLSSLKCAMSFPSKSFLEHHEAAHKAEGSLPCSKADKLLLGKEPIKKHKRGKNPSCSECGKTFSARSRLLLHQRVHKGAKSRSVTAT